MFISIFFLVYVFHFSILFLVSFSSLEWKPWYIHTGLFKGSLAFSFEQVWLQARFRLCYQHESMYYFSLLFNEIVSLCSFMELVQMWKPNTLWNKWIWIKKYQEKMILCSKLSLSNFSYLHLLLQRKIGLQLIFLPLNSGRLLQLCYLWNMFTTFKYSL